MERSPPPKIAPLLTETIPEITTQLFSYKVVALTLTRKIFTSVIGNKAWI